MNSTIFSKKAFKHIVIIMIWLVIWEIASLIVHNSILLVGPLDVVLELSGKLLDPEFYLSITFSLLKIGLGFFCGALLGIFLAALSLKIPFIGDLLSPLMAFMKAAPVASFIVLFLIWWHSSVLSTGISICIVLPQLYVSTLQGLKSADKDLLQMADVFRLHPLDVLHFIYRPALSGQLEGAVKISAGMAWKAGVAAEVIGTPDNSIGNGLYLSKIYLDTASVLSWTVVIILLSVLSEKILIILLNKYMRHDFKCHGSLNGSLDRCAPNALCIEGLHKKYDEKHVFEDYSQVFNLSEPTVLNWPSGKGKTTLFKIIAGIETADTVIKTPEKYLCSCVFQEDRLFENISALKNVEVIEKNTDKAKALLLKILDEEDILRPVNELSGGQRRRVAVARACAANADVVLFDEPYEGLDASTMEKVKKMIYEYGSDKIMLIASHIEA